MTIKRLLIILIGIFYNSPFVDAAMLPLTAPIKSNFLLSTPDQFSGATHWAHRKNITGRGESAIILEYGSEQAIETIPIHIREKAFIVPPADPEEEKKFAQSSFFSPSHGSWVLFFLNSIAPASTFLFLSPSDLYGPLPIPDRLSSLNSTDLKEKIKESIAINFSLAGLTSEDNNRLSQNRSTSSELSQIRKKISRMAQELINLAQFGNSKLIVVSAGNFNQNISNPFPRLSEKETVYDVGFSLATNPESQNSVIITGSLSHSYDLSLFSNYPGQNQSVQDRFLCTLGETPTEIKGTSFSAPIIVGAALLIKDEYPLLTTEEIQEALLESASKNFFIHKGGNRGKFIYDPQDRKPILSSFKGEDPDDLLLEEFNPFFYGKGILDLRAAFTYAELLRKNKRRKLMGMKPLSKGQLRTQMKRILKEQDRKAATTIQKIYKGHLVRKKIKDSPPSFPPPAYKDIVLL